MSNEILDKLRWGTAPEWFVEAASVYLGIADEKINEEMKRQYDHSILFMPVCGKCGHAIDETINVIKEDHFYSEKVVPCSCKKCGTYFNRIVMPAKFPFEGYFKENE
jgi:predicted Zn-ribbon and HTH transcriptional regulator